MTATSAVSVSARGGGDLRPVGGQPGGLVSEGAFITDGLSRFKLACQPSYEYLKLCLL